jgi:phosphoglycerate dehydrogenase-like enzyme
MTKPRIVVTPRSVTRNGHPALQRLRDAGFEVVCCTPGQQPDETELVRLLPGCVGYLAGVEKISAAVLAPATALRVISRNGVGVDNVDLAAARRQNIKVCPTPGANARGVAELAVGLMLALARSIPASDRAVKAGGWERYTGFELEGKTLGLIGCGRIGRLVAKMATGLDMRVIVHDIVPAQGSPNVSLVQLLAEADVCSLHCPARADGKPVLDAAMLEQMKRGALLINTARASLLDEAAVLAALESGQLGGLASDVLAGEPPANRQLAGHPRVIVTPHCGGLTRESVDRAVTQAVDNLLEGLA